MKLCWIIGGLFLVLAGLGTACGPETKYCAAERKGCEEVRLQNEQDQADRMRQQEAQADAGVSSRDAIIINGSSEP